MDPAQARLRRRVRALVAAGAARHAGPSRPRHRLRAPRPRTRRLPHRVDSRHVETETVRHARRSHLAGARATRVLPRAGRIVSEFFVATSSMRE